jgi:hypothetical protein
VTERGPSRVLRLPRERFDEVVETLSASFREYPVMRFILKKAGANYDTQLRHLVAYFTDSRFSRGWPVLGIEHEGGLVAAANVNPPRPAPRPPSLDPESAGVLLTTETPGNLPLYEHFGYRILGQARVDELTTWTLFRPD